MLPSEGNFEGGGSLVVLLRDDDLKNDGLPRLPLRSVPLGLSPLGPPPLDSTEFFCSESADLAEFLLRNDEEPVLPLLQLSRLLWLFRLSRLTWLLLLLRL